MAVSTFLVGDREFAYTKLPIRQQMKLWPRLARDLGPLLPYLSQDIKPEDFGKLIAEAAGILEHAETYLDSLIGQAETLWEVSPGQMKKVAARTFENVIFTDAEMVLTFIYKALQVEFGDFLARLGSGLNTPSLAKTP